MNSISIRQLKNIDSDYKLLEQWYQQEEVYHAFEQRKLDLDEIKKKYYPRTLTTAKVPVYMIEDSGVPIGIIQYKLVDNDDKSLYELDGEDIYELDIFIGDLKKHNKGIGSIAINLLTDFLIKEKNAKLLVMCPLKDNIKAMKCYEKCGFEIIKYYDTKDTIGDIQTYILMVKKCQ